MDKLNLGWLFDRRIKSIVVGVCTDIVIVAAMAGMNLDAVLAYMLPILMNRTLVFVLTYNMTIKDFYT